MKKCKYCQSDIDKKTKICPNCKKKQRKFPIWLRVVLGIIIVIIGVALLSDDNEATSQDENEYTFRFISDGKVLQEVTIKKGELLVEPESPTKEGYEFSHWATHENSIDGSEVFDFDLAPTESNTLFAHYNIIKQESNNQTSYGYEKIYNEYSQRLKDECPTLSITECATLSNEGVDKMAEYMYRASGTDGQYATYEMWAGKLMDVYLKEAR